MVNFGPLSAEICWRISGTPANLKGFCVLASFLQRCRSMEANQTLHDVWPSPGLVHCINIFGGSCPLMEFCQVQNSLFVQVLRSPILASSLHGTPVAGVSQIVQRWEESATCIRQGSRHIGHRPTLKFFCTFPFCYSLYLFSYFSIPSLSTRIVPLRFQAGGRRKWPNLCLVCYGRPM